MELTGKSAQEILNLDEDEQRLTMRLASELERWRWDNWAKVFGGK